MRRSSRLRYTAATSGRSSAAAVSFSTSDASAITWRTRQASSDRVRPTPRPTPTGTARPSSPPAPRLSPSATTRRWPGTGIPPRSPAAGSRSDTALTFRAAVRNALAGPNPAHLEDLGHLFERQALGERQRPAEHAALGDPRHDLERRRRALEAVFAGLERARPPAPPHRGAKDPFVGTTPAVGELAADRGRGGTHRDLDELLAALETLERRLELLARPHRPAGRHGRGDHPPRPPRRTARRASCVVLLVGTGAGWRLSR